MYLTGTTTPRAETVYRSYTAMSVHPFKMFRYRHIRFSREASVNKTQLTFVSSPVPTNNICTSVAPGTENII